MNTRKILNKSDLSAEEIGYLLQSEGEDKAQLLDMAGQVREQYLQKKVYLRGLIEFSNRCTKNCHYCGIRKNNRQVKRYAMTDEEILSATQFAYEHHYGSVVLQSGEVRGAQFTKRIENLLRKIHSLSDGNLRVTLSCGEQTYETYKRWFEQGAHRYLLRIESSNPALYQKIHPSDPHHLFARRMACLEHLKKAGYQVGTGVMIGLPFQTYEDLAADLLFMKRFEIDMVGMGPYLEHPHTPLYAYRHQLLTQAERLQLSLKMIAVLRLMMKTINIAASTALQAIDKQGREYALKAGANVIMPNITPGRYRDDYNLYENKPCTDQQPEDTHLYLENHIRQAGYEIAYDAWGDSEYFRARMERSIRSLQAKEGNEQDNPDH